MSRELREKEAGNDSRNCHEDGNCHLYRTLRFSLFFFGKLEWTPWFFWNKRGGKTTFHRPTHQVLPWFWKQSQSVHVRSVKESFWRVQGRVFRTGALSAAQLINLYKSEVHCFETIYWAELVFTQFMWIGFRSGSKWLLLLSSTGNLPFTPFLLNVFCYMSVTMCQKVQEKEASTLGKACYDC